jgi:hypothetical protein
MKNKICKRKDCGGKLIEVNIQLSGRTQHFCDNPKCDNYYICHCGVKFGEHGLKKELKK